MRSIWWINGTEVLVDVPITTLGTFRPFRPLFAWRGRLSLPALAPTSKERQSKRRAKPERVDWGLDAGDQLQCQCQTPRSSSNCLSSWSRRQARATGVEGSRLQRQISLSQLIIWQSRLASIPQITYDNLPTYRAYLIASTSLTTSTFLRKHSP